MSLSIQPEDSFHLLTISFRLLKRFLSLSGQNPSRVGTFLSPYQNLLDTFQRANDSKRTGATIHIRARWYLWYFQPAVGRATQDPREYFIPNIPIVPEGFKNRFSFIIIDQLFPRIIERTAHLVPALLSLGAVEPLFNYLRPKVNTKTRSPEFWEL